MKQMWEAQLDCKCIVHIRNAIGTDKAICPVHMGMHDIIAIETREWHLSCTKCRYGKWCGASLSDARIAERKHLVSKPGHTVQMGFITPDNIRELWRKVYGRKRTPRRFINPSERIAHPFRSAYAGIGNTKAEDPTDKPPF